MANIKQTRRIMWTPQKETLHVLIFVLVLFTGSALLAGCGPAPRPISLTPASTPATREGRNALYRKTVQAFLKGGHLPIIDMDILLAPKTDLAGLIETMDLSGVALAAVSAHEKETISRAVQRYPARIIPLTTSPRGISWSAPGSGHLASTRQELEAGAYGIGRVFLNLAPGKILDGEQKDPRANKITRQKAAFEALLRLSAEKKAPLWLNMEPEDNGLGWLERQFRAYVGASVIWNRAGYLPNSGKLPGYGHGLIRAITLRRPNLYFILTQRPPQLKTIFSQPRENLLIDPGEGFSPEWRSLLESRISHFHTGSSIKYSTPEIYSARIQSYRRRILEHLTPPTRQRLAFKNAWTRLTGSNWPGKAPAN
ncbi:MAG: hypothetical protein HOJ95_16400 [Nitrospinaceae bacterium]|jgi:hypothetical protein|nr:hypothetical protein [Nitrospinaceae bacterium]MBT5367958.1 hypothetical protein [Nitrospinaceae bacterium]MBT5949429.1 hypothetical protein [Nitrospinaceae bacterium]MBT6396277.1 hypothetical protein [Nitrospinaceae bacterium]MBT7857637.1 hypothetical protein [Nitrospinaceae bacterium]